MEAQNVGLWKGSMGCYFLSINYYVYRILHNLGKKIKKLIWI